MNFSWVFYFQAIEIIDVKFMDINKYSMNLRRLVISTFFLLCFSAHSSAQILKEWHGEWRGMMQMYKNGQTTDSVEVLLTIKSINDSILTWRTEYKSVNQPMTKDYTMKSVDVSKGVYATDEGGGLLLETYLIDNSLYNVFEVEGIMLTATYRLMGNEIVFEVTSGKKVNIVAGGVTNFSVNYLQKVHFKRKESKLLLNGGKGAEPAFFLDKKQISKEEMNAINPNDIESINVFKGEQAIKQFGPEFATGVVVIKLKLK